MATTLTRIDTDYVSRLAERMQAADSWGSGHRSSAWAQVAHIADLAAQRDNADTAGNYDTLTDLIDEIHTAAAQYADTARDLATEVAATELAAAHRDLSSRCDVAGIAHPDLTPDTVSAFAVTLTDEQVREIGAASDQTWGQSRGWFIEDGQIVGWAMIHGLSAGDSEYVEVTR